VYRKNSVKWKIKLAIMDIFVAGIFLLTFAFFHHVLPSLNIKPVEKPSVQLSEMVQPETVAPSEPEPIPEIPESVPTETEQADQTDPETETEPELEAEPVVDNRTEWQKKFEEHFSDEVIITDNSYKSPNVSIDIKTYKADFGNGLVTYYVADIYVGSIDNFVTYTAHNRMLYFDTQDPMEMHEESQAILSMTGDFMTYQKSGLLIRNGEIYDDSYTYCDICVLYPDGTMETYLKNGYDLNAIMERNPLQVWNFGPMLLDENGEVLEKFNSSTTVMQINPRSAVGYYEPGHYCFVVVDGRQDGHSVGMFMDELAGVFEALGCTAAYNLDGGGSALMMFGESHYSHMSNGADRNLGDILVIRESEVVE